jgi:tetratricopeptide (TPR) repeat protein/DNA-binding transcriptional MerR regulator
VTLDELARLSGMWVETVQLFYQRGLLPGKDSEKGFGAEHLEVVRFIGRIQADHHLPLDTIFEVLVSQCRFNLSDAERLLMNLVEPDPKRAGPGPANRETLMARTGVPEGLFSALVQEEFIPENGPYGGHHVWIVESVMELLSSGLSIEHVLRLGRIGSDIAETEAIAVVGALGRGTAPADALGDIEERSSAISRLVSAVRRNASEQLLASGASAGSESQRLTLESVHEPSHLFLARHDLENTLGNLRKQAKDLLTTVREDKAVLGDTRPLVAYGRLLVSLGRFGEAVATLEEAVKHPAGRRDAALWCYLSLARAMTGAVTEALDAGRQAIEQAPKSSRAFAYYATVCAIVAARAGDLIMATAYIQEAIESAHRSRECDVEGSFQRLESLLARGRLLTVLCESEIGEEQGRSDLEELLGLSESPNELELGFESRGTRDILRVNAAFFLAMACEEAGEKKRAQQLFSEVIALDPVSAFGKVAYERLNVEEAPV